jgi:competence protein ComEA
LDEMKPWWAIALAIIGSLLAAGLLFLTVQQPRGQPVKLRPPPTPAPIMVDVAGAVAHPGLYALPVGSRVSHALEAAGGLTAWADANQLNLAAILVDGEQVQVPSSMETALPDGVSPSARITGMGDLVNINTASQADLESLPEIGPKIAQAIITYRTEHGLFATIEEIQDVAGIGPAVFDQIRPLITVQDSP